MTLDEIKPEPSKLYVRDPKDDATIVHNYATGKLIENMERERDNLIAEINDLNSSAYSVSQERELYKNRWHTNSKFNSFVVELRFTICFLFLFGCVTLLLYNSLEIRRQTIECQKPG